jgi:oligoendopeptidase F
MNNTSFKRQFLPQDFKLTTWEALKPYFEQLLAKEINSPADFRQWLQFRSELESVLEEDAGWRYIRMTCDTANEEKQQAYNYFITEISPQTQPFSNAYDKKLLESPYLSTLTSDADVILKKSVETQFKIFREESIPVFTEIQQDQVKYGSTVGVLTVTIDGEEMTLQKASNLLMNPDRKLRESVYFELQKTRLSVKTTLDQLFDDLIAKRDKVAKQAGFANFRDYMFESMCRFDYTPQDCFDFHDAVAKEVVPILNKLALERKNALKLETLKPWDLSVDKLNRLALKPFENAAELTQKTVACFNLLDPFIGNCIVEMEKMGNLDLESRKGKAPGGYNYPLYESGYPFIFMNSVGSMRDLVTMVHEGGHALHSILTKDLELVNYKSFPSEVAELASMSMELLSMEHWDLFFTNDEDLKRAKKDHLEQIIETLPWVATIDKFQHWLYENPTHSQAERTQKWNEIHSEFASNLVDWTDLEDFKSNIWQKQLHLFEVPFYYIEYGMAQLGAIAVWKNFKENPHLGLAKYLNALKLGYTKSIADIYAQAGIQFDFSQKNIKELMNFVNEELEKLV